MLKHYSNVIPAGLPPVYFLNSAAMLDIRRIIFHCAHAQQATWLAVAGLQPGVGGDALLWASQSGAQAALLDRLLSLVRSSHDCQNQLDVANSMLNTFVWCNRARRPSCWTACCRWRRQVSCTSAVLLEGHHSRSLAVLDHSTKSKRGSQNTTDQLPGAYMRAWAPGPNPHPALAISLKELVLCAQA